MHENQTICHGCLSHISKTSTACPYCGRKFVNNNPKGTLNARTVIAKRYILDKCVSLDGEGISYMAVDISLAKRVLIKEYVPVTMCSHRTQSGAVVPRQEREVLYKTTLLDFIDLYKSLISIEKTIGICKVYDLVQYNNTAYAVQEVPTGTTLSTYLQTRTQRLTYKQALSLLRPVFNAVEVMHAKGLLHRGISPDTIFITSDGRAKLTGFATIGLRTKDSEIRSQIFEGYAAPEQYSVAEFDGKYTDIYGLGAVFYKLITGTTPPPANKRRLSDTLVSAKNFVPDLPPYVSVSLMRALRLTGVERMKSAYELFECLSEPRKIKKTPFIQKSKRVLAITAAAAGAIIVVISLILLITTNQNGNSQSEVTPSSVSQASSQVSAIEQVTVPNFVNKEYAAVQQDEFNIKHFLFSVTEDYSSVFAVGKIIEQTPREGQTVDSGTVIEIIVSRGPKTVQMPTVVGSTRVQAKADLDALGITYNIFERANNGDLAPDTVVDCDVAAGTAIDPETVTVTLYVAQQPPEGVSLAPSTTS